MHTPAIDIFGAVGSGKTTLGTAMLLKLALDAGGARFSLRNPPSNLQLAQYRRMASGKFPLRTKPTEGDALHETARCETLPLELRGVGALDMIFRAGEDLDVLIRANQVADIRAMASEYARGMPRLLGVTLDWTRTSDPMSRLALKAMGCYVCEMYVKRAPSGDATMSAAAVAAGSGRRSLLRTAIETAAFSLHELAPEELHRIHSSIGDRFQNLPEDARLVPSGDMGARPEDRFEIESDVMSDREKLDVIQALDSLAATLVNRDAVGLTSLRPLIEQSEQVILLFTRGDLLEKLAPYNVQADRVRAECLGPIDRAFKPRQIVELNHVSLDFQDDWRKAAASPAEDRVWVKTTAMLAKTEWLDRLADSIDDRLSPYTLKCRAEAEARAVAEAAERAEAEARARAVAAAERRVFTSRDSGNDRISESTWSVLFRLAPLFTAVTLGIAWLVPGGFSPMVLSKLMIGVACLVVAAWARKIYLATEASPPSWRVEGRRNDPTQRVYLATATPDGFAPSEMTVCTSPTARLFDLGFARSGSMRWVVVPQFKRFLDLSGIQAEGSALTSALDVSRVCVLAVGFVLVAAHVFLGL